MRDGSSINFDIAIKFVEYIEYLISVFFSNFLQEIKANQNIFSDTEVGLDLFRQI